MRLASASAQRSAVLCVVALVPVAILAASSIVLASRQVTNVVDSQVQTTAAVSAEVIGQQTESLVALVHSYATRPSLVNAMSGRPGSETTIDLSLQSLVGAFPGISASFVADVHGTSLDTYPRFPAAIGKNFAYREWFTGLVASGRPYVSSAIETAEDSHTLAVTITDYVRDTQGRPSRCPRRQLQPHVHPLVRRGRRRGTGHQLARHRQARHLADIPWQERARLRRARSSRPSRSRRAHRADGLRAGVLDGRSGSVELSAYAPVPGTGWTVVASKDKDIAFAGLARLRTTVLTITAFLVLILLAGVWVIVRSDRRRRDSERLVQRRDRELAKVLESTDEGFVSIDGTGAITRWNTQAEKIYGWAAPEVLGRNAMETVLPAEVRQEYTDDLAGYRAGQGSKLVGKRVELTALHRDGHQIPLEVGVWAHDDGDGFSAFVHDITDRVAIQAELETERRRLTEAQRLGQMGGFECDFGSATWVYSGQMYELWGVEHGGFSSEVFAGLIHEADTGVADESWADAMRLGGRHIQEFRIHRASDGAERVLRATLEVDLGPDDQPLRVRGTHLDITDLTLAEKAAQRANAFFDAVLAASPDFTFVYDLVSGASVYTSRDKDLLGMHADQLQALGPEATARLVHPEDQPRLDAINTAAADLEDGQVLQLHYRGQHVDGHWHWLSRRITPFRRNAAGAVIEVLGVVRDISDVIESEQRLTHAALHDGLTGLPNRALLIDRLDAALARSARDGREVAVLFCDLDGFKRVNDIAGHAAGDALLLEIAQRFHEVIREHDTVARVGGDEFVIIVEPWNRPDAPAHGNSPEEEFAADRLLAVQVAKRVAATLQQPVTVKGVNHVVSASIGITYATLGPGGPAGTVTAEQVLQDADTAMYLAKGRGRDRFEVFEHGLHTDVAERVRVEQLLRQALRQLTHPAAGTAGKSAPTFTAAYQPVFDSGTGGLTGFEALARLIDGNG